MRAKKVVYGIFLSVLLICLAGCKPVNTDTAKSYTEDYTFSDWGLGVAIERYTGEERTVYLPAEHNGKKVLCIKEDAFYQCADIEEIVFSDSITHIEGAPFYRCCSLKKVVLNKELSYLDGNPFYRCTALDEIVLNGENAHFTVADNVLYDKGITKLICYPEGKRDKQYVVPESVTCFGSAAFGYHPQELTEIKIHENVTAFEDQNSVLTAYPTKIKLIVKENSAAEAYAKESKQEYEYYE